MVKRVRFSFVLLTVIFVAILYAYAKLAENDREGFKQRTLLIHENTQRIKDIQVSRVNSCKQTYEGIRKVFKPFFPPPPRTPKQNADLKKFNTTVNKLKAQCIRQISTKSKPRSLNER